VGGLAAAATTALTWGLVGTLVRLLPALTPLELVAGRLLFALAAALPALAAPPLRAQLRDAARRPTAWALAALMSAYYLLAVAAFRLAPVADVALLLATAPLCALGLRRLRGVPATGAERTGAALALLGVALTLVPSLRGLAAGGATRLAGDALALAAAALSAAYALRFRAAQASGAAPAPFGVAVLTFALGATALAVRAALAGAPLLPLQRLDVGGLALLGALGVLSTLVPTLSFAIAARRLPPVLTSAAQLLVPVVSGTAAALALGELPSIWLVPGGALVALGLLRLLTAPATPVAAPVD
jgi:drug/metabolite transporter (DMT)-like permease